MRTLSAMGLLVCLTACGQGMDGTYVDDMQASRYVFGRDGEVSVEVMGVLQPARYAREGDRLEIQLPGRTDTLQFSIAEDGRLIGPMGVTLHEVAR